MSALRDDLPKAAVLGDGARQDDEVDLPVVVNGDNPDYDVREHRLLPVQSGTRSHRRPFWALNSMRLRAPSR